MKHRQHIHPQENVVIVKKSSLPIQTDDLEGKGKLKLVKGVDAFPVVPSYPSRSGRGKVPRSRPK